MKFIVLALLLGLGSPAYASTYQTLVESHEVYETFTVPDKDGIFTELKGRYTVYTYIDGAGVRVESPFAIAKITDRRSFKQKHPNIYRSFFALRTAVVIFAPFSIFF